MASVSSPAYLNFSSALEDRIVFKKGTVNPRSEIGKIGIRTHNIFTRFFYDVLTIKISGDFVHLNRKSAVKWINAQVDNEKRLPLNASDREIGNKIRELLKQGPLPVAQQVRLSRAPLSKQADEILGRFWNAAWNFFLSSWTTFKMRFLLMSESQTLNASQSRANAIFHKAAKQVPAYRAELAKQGDPKNFGEIPIVDKKSYVIPLMNENRGRDLCLNGTFPVSGIVDTSTGTTGKPTMWARGPEEMAVSKKLMHFGQQMHFGDKPLVFINTFKLGKWATGVQTAIAFAETSLIHNPGPDHIEDTLEALRLYHPPEQYSDRKFVIAGYPPFIRKLVDAANDQGINLRDYHITAVVGGEGISETTRKYLTDNGLDEVISAYGASDLDFPIGQESSFTAQLAKICAKEEGLRKELFGEEQMPMIFQYDPLSYFIETDQNGHLIYTCVRDDRISPRVRYNLHDVGQTLPMSELRIIAKKYDIDLPEDPSRLPLLFIWNRDGAVLYGSTKVTIEDFERSIKNIQELDGRVERFAFRFKKNGAEVPQIGLMIEWKADVQLDLSQEEIHKRLIEELKKVNQDFREAVSTFHEANLPYIELYSHGTGPMANAPSHGKKKNIFTD